jgi:NADH dehydrogenase
MSHHYAAALRHRVVVIGSGFGGLFAAQSLARADAEVTVVARTSHHLFQPLLYQVATGILSEGEIAPSTREVLSSQRNAHVLQGDVVDIDLASQTITATVADGQVSIGYESLIVAAGAGQSWFGQPAFAEHAPGMKTIDDALELRGRIFGAFERAELAARRGEDVEHLLTFVVVGAGPTGVEMAGQIAELAHRTLRNNFRYIDTRRARVVLLDGASQVLPTFGHRLGRKASAQLEQIGVEVVLGAMVTHVDAEGIEARAADGSSIRIESVCKVWAAGVEASPLAALLADQTGAPLDRAGRIRVNSDLTLPGHPEVFVVGDMMCLDGLPGVAQVAVQGGRYAARAVQRRLEKRPPLPPFAFHDKGSMATISRFHAVATVGRLSIAGLAAWMLWLLVHLAYLIGFKNRVTTALHWTVSFLGSKRAQRTHTHQQVHGRAALMRVAEYDSPVAASGP